jgi:hypothetical protein
VVARADLDGCGKTASNGFQSPNRPAHSVSLYRRSHPGSRMTYIRSIVKLTWVCVTLILKYNYAEQNSKLEKVAGDSFSNTRVGASVILVCRRHLDARRAVMQAHDK